jgi:hypothetical protein
MSWSISSAAGKYLTGSEEIIRDGAFQPNLGKSVAPVLTPDQNEMRRPSWMMRGAPVFPKT